MENKQCYNCHYEAEWREHYLLAVQRFDKSLNKAIAATMIAVVVSLICIIITAFLGLYVINFINSFEYVEETTTYSIEQDGEGLNTAVIGESNEVNVYGTEDH